MNKAGPVVAIIQARVKSERLPGKVLLPLAGKPLIDHVIDRALAIEGVTSVVLATGNGPENHELEVIARKRGIEFFAGSDSNVLERYVQAAEKFSPEYIIRITADNPLIDSRFGTFALEHSYINKPDLASVGDLPLGTAVEVIRHDALLKAFDESSEPYHFEHVTPYIKEHPELFAIERYVSGFYNPFDNLRLTVDTREDYTLMKIIFRSLYRGSLFSLDEVVSFMSENSHLLNLNSSIHQRAMTHAALPYVAS